MSKDKNANDRQQTAKTFELHRLEYLSKSGDVVDSKSSCERDSNSALPGIKNKNYISEAGEEKNM